MLKATRGYIEAIATALSDNGKITFKEAENWKTDISKKEIEYNPIDLQKLPANAAKGLILHETAHVKYTSDIKHSQLAKDNPSLHDVYNVLEDIRIEEKLEKNYGEWSNEGIEENASIAGLDHIQKVKDGTFAKMPKLQQYLLNVLAKNYVNKFYRNGDIYRSQQTMKNVVEADVSQQLYTTEDDVINFAKNSHSTEEIVDYVDNILYPKLKEFIDEANKEPQQSLHAMGKKPPQVGSLKGNGRNKARIPTDEELELLLSPYINTLAQRLADVLKERASTRFTGSYKHGKLLSKNAYKVMTDDTRIFSKKKNPNIPHYVVSFLLDESGSMQGERHENTYIGSYLLKRACEKLHFKINWLKFESNAEMIPDLSRYRTHFKGGGNDEERALELIRKNTDPKDDNLILVLTDGGAGCDPRPLITKMQKENYDIVAVAVGLGKNDGETSELQRNYPYTAVAEQVENLPRIMIELLRKLIHR